MRALILQRVQEGVIVYCATKRAPFGTNKNGAKPDYVTNGAPILSILTAATYPEGVLCTISIAPFEKRRARKNEEPEIFVAFEKFLLFFSGLEVAGRIQSIFNSFGFDTHQHAVFLLLQFSPLCLVGRHLQNATMRAHLKLIPTRAACSAQ